MSVYNCLMHELKSFNWPEYSGSYIACDLWAGIQFCDAAAAVECGCRRLFSRWQLFVRMLSNSSLSVALHTSSRDCQQKPHRLLQQRNSSRRRRSTAGLNHAPLRTSHFALRTSHFDLGTWCFYSIKFIKKILNVWCAYNLVRWSIPCSDKSGWKENGARINSRILYKANYHEF